MDPESDKDHKRVVQQEMNKLDVTTTEETMMLKRKKEERKRSEIITEEEKMKMFVEI